MNEYMRRLFRICRRRYGRMEELIKTDEQHRFWAVQTGCPVCCRKTVNNLEAGHCATDEDITEFLIGKLGFRYISGEQESERLTALASGLKEAIIKGDVAEVEKLKGETDTLNYEGVFLFDLWQLLLQSACRFYLFNSFAGFEQLLRRRIDTGVFPEDMVFLYRYQLAFRQVFITGEFASANVLISQMDEISEYDLALLVCAQVESEELLRMLSREYQQRIDCLDDRQKERLLYWLKAAVSANLFCHQSPAQRAETLNLNAVKIAENRECIDRRFLREIGNCRNPLFGSLIRRKALAQVRDNHHYRILYDVIEQLEL
ncbi:MAG: hypothetical protein K6A14_03565 [Erysipelotrichaceae bacterium]|nr:hypothetical protein [Erysipelotrichaceae bacterium]